MCKGTECPFLAAVRAEIREVQREVAQPQASGPLLVTVKQASELLSLGQTEVYALIARGELASVKVGRLRRIPAQALHNFVASLQEGAGHDT